MSDTTSETEVTRSRSAKRVSEWKAELQTFFRDDWSRLRSLILQLEEQTWYPDPASLPPVSGSGNRVSPPGIDELLQSAAGRPESVEESDEAAPSEDRLNELARRLEQQLRISHRRRT